MRSRARRQALALLLVVSFTSGASVGGASSRAAAAQEPGASTAARRDAAEAPSTDSPAERAPSAAAAVPFRIGETLTYSVAYAFLEAGSLRLAVEGVEEVGERKAYHLTFRAQTNPTVSAIYSLKDNLQSWMDVERLHSLQFVKESIEKGKRRDRSYRLDQERRVRVDRTSGEERPMPADAQDDVSLFYFLRTLPLEDGKRFTLNNLMDFDDNPMRVSVLGIEFVRVPAGTFRCFVLDLDVHTDSGVFSQGNELKVWITDDARRIPVKIDSKLAVGSFTASLTEEQPGDGMPPAAGALPAER